MKRIAILGAGTAGTMMANKLREAVSPDWTVTVFDKDDDHVYQPGLLFVPFGEYRVEDLVRSRARYLTDEVEFVIGAIDAVDADERVVRMGDGTTYAFDILIVATGARIAPELTEGLAEGGWHESAFDFYTPQGAEALRLRLAELDGGRIVVNVVDMPIKCPVAPLEFLLLADAWATERGIRDGLEIVYATPLDAAFTKPIAAQHLGDLLTARGIEVVPNFHASRVDGAAQRLESFEGSTLDYDVLVSIPLHTGAEIIRRSGLGDADGFVPTDKHTLQSKAHPHVFALGDATDLPTSKAGSVAHFQGEVLLGNILRFIDGQPLDPAFDGHANCFIETGHGKAMLIDFNYDTEPLPGRFPLPGLGPFRLLEESEANHWGKLAFRWIYWNVLIRGEEMPLDHRMATAGKWSAK